MRKPFSPLALMILIVACSGSIFPSISSVSAHSASPYSLRNASLRKNASRSSRAAKSRGKQPLRTTARKPLERNKDISSKTPLTKKPASKAAVKGAASSTSSTSSRRTSAIRTARYTRRQPPVQAAPTPQRISQIQAALADKGSYQGELNGKWDDATVEAMKQFQTANGLTPTGKLDALTLEKLGLGAPTAGRGAPLFPTPTANLSPAEAPPQLTQQLPPRQTSDRPLQSTAPQATAPPTQAPSYSQ